MHKENLRRNADSKPSVRAILRNAKKLVSRTAVILALTSTTALAGAFPVPLPDGAFPAGEFDIHISVDGKDHAECGYADSPCASLVYAIGLAGRGGVLRLGPGTFKERDLVLRHSMRIIGSGVGKTIIDAGQKGRHFVVLGGRNTIANLTLTGGRVDGPDEMSTPFHETASLAGSILNDADLTLDTVAFLGNEAVGQAGKAGQSGRNGGNGRSGKSGREATCPPFPKKGSKCHHPSFAGSGTGGGSGSSGTAGTAGQDAMGGALFSNGTLTVRNTLFEGNRAVGGAGGPGGSGGAGGAGGHGGNGGYTVYKVMAGRIQVSHATCRDRPGGNAGRGGNGGAGGAGGNAGSAHGGAIVLAGEGESAAAIANTIMRGNEALAGARGAAGAGGKGGAGGRGGRGGSSPGCIDEFDSDRSPGRNGATGRAGAAGTPGEPGESTAGAVHVKAAMATTEDGLVTFAGNDAGTANGRRTPVLSNIILAGNLAQAASALDLRSPASVYHATIAGNVARSGGPVVIGPGESAGPVVLANSAVFWNAGTRGTKAAHGGANGPAAVSGVLLTNSCVSGLQMPTDRNSLGLFDCAPNLLPPAGNDDRFGTADDLFEVGIGSVLVDTASTAHLGPDAADIDRDGDRDEPLPLDITGAARVEDYAVSIGSMSQEPGLLPDIGAHEGIFPGVGALAALSNFHDGCRDRKIPKPTANARSPEIAPTPVSGGVPLAPSIPLAGGIGDKSEKAAPCWARLDGVWRDDSVVQLDTSAEAPNMGSRLREWESLAHGTYTTPRMVLVGQSDDPDTTLVVYDAKEPWRFTRFVSTDGLRVEDVLQGDNVRKVYVAEAPATLGNKLTLDSSASRTARLRIDRNHFQRPEACTVSQQSRDGAWVQAQLVRSMRAALRGYDVAEQDPFILNYTQDGRKPVFEETDDFCYNEARAVSVGWMPMEEGLEGVVFNNSIITSETEYQQSVASSFGVATQTKAGDANDPSFTASYGSSSAQEQMNSMREQSTVGIAVAHSRHKRFALVLQEPWVAISEDFKNAVFDAKHGGLDAEAPFEKIIRDFGTHFPYAVTYGSASKLIRSFNEQSFQKRTASMDNFKEEGGAALFGTGASFSEMREDSISEGSGQTRTNERVDCVAVGGVGSTSCEAGASGEVAYPILLDLRPLDQLLTPLHFPNEPEIYGPVRAKLKAKIVEYLKHKENRLSAAPLTTLRGG